MPSIIHSRRKRNSALALFLQYYLWSFSLVIYHRDLQGQFSKTELRRWHGITKNAHFFTTIMAMRILNEFFRKTDNREDMRAHHFGFQSRGQFIPQAEINRVSKVFMHASYGALQLRRPDWNMGDWYRKLTDRVIPFLEFLREHHYSRSSKARNHIDQYLSMTENLMAYVERVVADEYQNSSS